MKAVVLEIKGKYAAVLRTDGEVCKVPAGNLRVGDEIDFVKETGHRNGSTAALRTLAAAAAVLLIVTSGLGIYRSNNKESAYLTLDVNPSLEYALNSKCKVLKVTPLNEDAVDIARSLEERGIKGEKMENALESTKELLYEGGYLGEEKENIMLMAVVTDDSRVRQNLIQTAESAAVKDEVEVYVVDASFSEREIAIEQGVSTGRYEVSKKAETVAAEKEKESKPAQNSTVAAKKETVKVEAQTSSVRELVESSELTPVKPVATPTSAAMATAAVPSQAAKPGTGEKVPTLTQAPTAQNDSPKPSGKKPGKDTNSDNSAENGGATATPTAAAAPTGEPRPTVTAAATATATPTAAATATPAPTATAAATPTPTLIPTATATPAVTATPTLIPTATATPVPTQESIVTPAPTGDLPTEAPKPTLIPTATATPIPTATATPTPTPTNTVTPTATVTPVAEPTAIATPMATPVPLPSPAEPDKGEEDGPDQQAEDAE